MVCFGCFDFCRHVTVDGHGGRTWCLLRTQSMARAPIFPIPATASPFLPFDSNDPRPSIP